MRRLWIAVLFAAVPWHAAAQDRANFPWWNSPVTQEIGLTSEQSQRIHQIVRSYRDRLLDARNNALKAQEELEDVMNGAQVDPNAAKPAIDKLVTARADTSRVFLEMSVQLRSVLTLDQWRQLVRRWDEVKRKRQRDTQVPP